jgi:hypothetical protein
MVVKLLVCIPNIEFIVTPVSLLLVTRSSRLDRILEYRMGLFVSIQIDSDELRRLS